MTIQNERTELERRINECGMSFVDSDGKVLTARNEFETEVQNICEQLMQSEYLFGGRSMGTYPDVEKVNVDEVYRLRANENNKREERKVSSETSGQMGKVLNQLCKYAIDNKVSDIHIKITETETHILVRVDGAIRRLQQHDTEYGQSLLSYIFLNEAKESGYSVIGEYDAQFSVLIGERYYNWRISQMPINGGAKATIRNLDAGDGTIPKLTDLGLSSVHTEIMKNIAHSRKGAVLISGPTGSGKTTLLMSTLDHVPTDRIVHTLEDPVEWKSNKPNMMQTNVDARQSTKTNEKKDFGFYQRKILRNDTDVVLCGEIRSKEVANEFFRMADTGQLALGTLHTSSAVGSVSALIEQLGVAPSQVASPGVLKAIVHQRLIKTLCSECKISINDAKKICSENENESVEIKNLQSAIYRVGNLNINSSNVYFRRTAKLRKKIGKCESCSDGEKGRTAVLEIIIIDDEDRDFISRNDLLAWHNHLHKKGWLDIKEHGKSKVQDGSIDIRSIESELDGLKDESSESVYKDLRSCLNLRDSKESADTVSESESESETDAIS